MVKRNENFAKLQGGYLFPEILKRKREFLSLNPDAHVISLGIGDTTEPITPHVVQALQKQAAHLGTREGYVGYSPEQGIEQLRKLISHRFYHDHVHADEVYVSDGAKCDLGRLQLLFGSKVSIAVQDPTYPVYVDGSVFQGATEEYNAQLSIYEGLSYMPCMAENGFFPDLEAVPRPDIIYFCSPNNPTGAVATHAQLKKLVDFAKHSKSIIVYDASYAAYIQDKSLPKSIYEIEGAKSVAIEVGSFSKIAGFTGVRLGWTIIPRDLKYDDGTSVKTDWHRLFCTIFNGSSIISQHGGLAILDDKGFDEVQKQMRFYLENAKIIRNVLENKKFRVYGGNHVPYLWVNWKGKASWDAFQEVLEKAHIVTTPGVGFGPSGEGYLRLSAFGHRDTINQAAKRLEEIL